jgi:hypothetical protein
VTSCNEPRISRGSIIDLIGDIVVRLNGLEVMIKKVNLLKRFINPVQIIFSYDHSMVNSVDLIPNMILSGTPTNLNCKLNCAAYSATRYVLKDGTKHKHIREDGVTKRIVLSAAGSACDMEMEGIMKTYYVSYHWCLWSYKKNIGVKLTRIIHPGQRLGSQSRKY